MKKIDPARFREKYGPWGLVAGASQGMGAEFATQIAAHGLNVVLIARNEDKLTALAEQLASNYSVQTRVLALDLAAPEAVSTILSFVHGLEIGLLVYNAGFSTIGSFWEIPLEQHSRELQINSITPMALVHALGQGWIQRRRGGAILLSSLSATQGSAYISNYAAAKAYNQVLAEGLWEEMRGCGVDILACCPSAVATPNYLESLEKYHSRGATPAMPPADVVAETLAALGHGPEVIPGGQNRLAAFFIRHLLPRPLAVRLMGRVLRGMYQPKAAA